MPLEPWDELRTALHVARAGTVSGAAATLGVHHATVIRHIDAIEDRLGIKLFQRHAKGYGLTEAGAALADEAAATEARLENLAARLRAMESDISGDLIVTTVPELSTFLMPAFASLVAQYPALLPCLRIESRILRLEYGEAHIAIRAGTEPQEPDNIVQSLGKLPVALYASKSYLAEKAAPEAPWDDFSNHSFIGPEKHEARAPFDHWLHAQGAPIRFFANDPVTRRAAIDAGLGLGFLAVADASASLVQVAQPQLEWAAPIWMVTHVDLHRSPKVQQASTLLKRHLSPRLMADR